jgi:predicted nucleic acid-binding protein
VFLDTGYVIALEAIDDQYHDAAVQHWRGFIAQLPPLVTTSYVFDEVVTFFNSRNQHAKASEIGNRLLRSPTVQLVHVDQALFYDAWRYFTQHADKSYSLTDCVSFLVMERLAFARRWLSINTLSRRDLKSYLETSAVP